MVAYNFMQKFAGPVELGLKTLTIRDIKTRKHAEPGDKLQLYTGMRSPNCRKLREPDPTCTGARDITITPAGVMKIDGIELTPNHATLLAIADGFPTKEAFIAFHCPEGKGVLKRLIEWEPMR